MSFHFLRYRSLAFNHGVHQMHAYLNQRGLPQNILGFSFEMHPFHFLQFLTTSERVSLIPMSICTLDQCSFFHLFLHFRKLKSCYQLCLQISCLFSQQIDWELADCQNTQTLNGLSFTNMLNFRIRCDFKGDRSKTVNVCPGS